MSKLLLLIAATLVMILLFAAVLHFTRYRKRKPGCCGNIRMESDKDKKNK